MNLADELARLRAALADLAERPGARDVFGASRHAFRLAPPLAERTVAAFEAKHGVALPAGYRAFVRHLGASGAGPFYGLLKLGHIDHAGGSKPCKVGVDVGVIGAPFPHTERWNWSPQQITALHGDESGELERAYYKPFDGAIPLAHEGCALRDWLVVSGPEAGNVWHDATADFGGLVPWGSGAAAKKAGHVVWSGSKGPQLHRLDFLTWYAAWLAQTAGELAPRGKPRARR